MQSVPSVGVLFGLVSQHRFHLVTMNINNLGKGVSVHDGFLILASDRVSSILARFNAPDSIGLALVIDPVLHSACR
jgi:hypothetical protein